MTFVVTENCINCKHTTCVDVCPADAFREGANFLVIDPEACVDCDLCPSECPEDAIFREDEVPEEQLYFVELNRVLAEAWPEIIASQKPLPDCEKWTGVDDKLQHLVS